MHQQQLIGKRISFRQGIICRFAGQKCFERLTLPFGRNLPAQQAQPQRGQADRGFRPSRSAVRRIAVFFSGS